MSPKYAFLAEPGFKWNFRWDGAGGFSPGLGYEYTSNNGTVYRAGMALPTNGDNPAEILADRLADQLGVKPEPRWLRWQKSEDESPDRDDEDYRTESGILVTDGR